LFDVIIFSVLVGLYLCLKTHTPSRNEAYLAIIVYGSYLICYQWIGPVPQSMTKYMGLLYGLLPLLSTGAILLPHLNDSFSTRVTRVVGWLGLMSTSSIMTYFKLFQW